MNMDADSGGRGRSTTTNSEILRRLDELSHVLDSRVERIEAQVADQEKRITRIETLFTTIGQRFDMLEKLITSRNGLEERQWKVIVALLVIIGVAVGGVEAAKLLAGMM